MIRQNARCGAGTALLFAGMVCGGFSTLAQTVQSPAARGGAGPTLAQGMSALRENQARAALGDFQGVLAADPNNTAANLLASTAAVELFQGPLAVQYAEKAEKLDPGNWKIHTTLVAAYSAAGMKEKRDHERQLLEQMHRTGAADARLATGFLVEMFPVGVNRVDAIEYFEPVGRFHTYYRFLVRQADGKRIGAIDVQSDDFDQKSWAQAHPAEAASGNRQFQITGQGEDGQTVDYRMFSGQPDYDNIRVMVVEALRTHPMGGTQAAATGKGA
ncbi:MAG: tetratricopeptide repeat protein [Acidobacteriota bacterium]